MVNKPYWALVVRIAQCFAAKEEWHVWSEHGSRLLRLHLDERPQRAVLCLLLITVNPWNEQS